LKSEHILVVEDDLSVAQWLQEYLSLKNYRVDLLARGDLAVPFILEHKPDVVILDGMLPGLDGLDVCKAVRPEFENSIIMLTARDEEIDEVLGLEVGADDYLTKPVRARVLEARIRKCLQRQQQATPASETATSDQCLKLEFGGLQIDAQARAVQLEQQAINISTHEFDLLWILAERAGTVVTRDELMQSLRGFEYDGFDRTVDLGISKLRKKLNDNASQPYRIKTVWRQGYLLVKDAW